MPDPWTFERIARTGEELLSSVYTATPENQAKVAQAARECGCEACVAWLERNPDA